MVVSTNTYRLSLRTWRAGFLAQLRHQHGIRIHPLNMSAAAVRQSLAWAFSAHHLGPSGAWTLYRWGPGFILFASPAPPATVATAPSGIQCCRFNRENLGLRVPRWFQAESAALAWPSWLGANRRGHSRQMERPGGEVVEGLLNWKPQMQAEASKGQRLSSFLVSGCLDIHSNYRGPQMSFVIWGNSILFRNYSWEFLRNIDVSISFNKYFMLI